MRQSPVPELTPGKHICLISNVFPEANNPIRAVYEKLILVIVVERSTGIIVDCEVNFTCELSAEFIRAIYVGKNLITDSAAILSAIQTSYYGTSSKALLVVTKNILNRYQEICAADAAKLNNGV